MNSKSVYSHGKTLTTDGHALTAQLNEFLKTATQHAQRLRAEAEQLQKKDIEGLAVLSDRAGEQTRKVQEVLQLVQTKENVSDDAMRTIQGVVETAFDGMQKGFATWSESMQKSCHTMCADLHASSTSAFGEVSSRRLACRRFNIELLIGRESRQGGFVVL